MSRLLRQGLIPTLIGLGLGGAIGAPSQAQFFSPETQSSETVIIIGGSPEEWDYYSGYWQQLMELNPQSVEAISEDEGETEAVLTSEEQQAYVRSLAKKLVVKDLRLKNVSRRFGQSQVTGTLTNLNDEAVVIQGINFEVLQSNGQLLQTGSAVPQPNIVASGQTVTFTELLLTVQNNRRFRVQLLEPAVTFQPQRAPGSLAAQ